MCSSLQAFWNTNMMKDAVRCGALAGQEQHRLASAQQARANADAATQPYPGSPASMQQHRGMIDGKVGSGCGHCQGFS